MLANAAVPLPMSPRCRRRCIPPTRYINDTVLKPFSWLVGLHSDQNQHEKGNFASNVHLAFCFVVKLCKMSGNVKSQVYLLDGFKLIDGNLANISR